MKYLEKNIDLGLLILRLSIGILMLLHGIYKLCNGIAPIEQMVINLGLPGIFAYGVYVGEVVASLFIIIGLATRLASAVFIINCITAVLMAHCADVFTLNSAGGWAIELLGLYTFGALALLFTGGGKYAVSNKYIWD